MLKNGTHHTHVGEVLEWWVLKSEVKMSEKKVLEVKVKETDSNNLPKELQGPGKDRTFKCLREDDKRYLLAMPKGIGHQADTKEFGSQDSWWVPKESVEVLKQEGGEEEKKMEKKTEKVTEKVTEKESVVAEAGHTFKQMVLSDATQAAYIVAGTTLTKGVQAAILKVLENQLRERYGRGKGSASKVSQGLETMKMFLESPFGQATIMASIGYGLGYVPTIKDDPRAQQLARNLRVQGIATAGNAVMGVGIEHVIPVIMSAINGLPALGDVQVPEIQLQPEVETVSAGGSAGAARVA